MTDDQLRDLLRGVATDEHFEPGFASRVSARLASSASPAEGLSRALARHAARLIPAVLAASIALVAWSYTAAPPAENETVALTNAEVFQ